MINNNNQTQISSKETFPDSIPDRVPYRSENSHSSVEERVKQAAFENLRDDNEYDEIDLNNNEDVNHKKIVDLRQNSPFNKVVSVFLSVRSEMIKHVARLCGLMHETSAEILDGFFGGKQQEVGPLIYTKIETDPQYQYRLQFNGNNRSYSQVVSRYLFPVRSVIGDHYRYLMSSGVKVSGKKSQNYLGSGSFNKVKVCTVFDMYTGDEKKMAFKFTKPPSSNSGSVSLSDQLNRLKMSFPNPDGTRGLGLPIGYTDYIKESLYDFAVERRVYVDILYDGDLNSAAFKAKLNQSNPNRVKFLTTIFADCLAGLANLHQSGFWHRDVKLENMVFSADKEKGVLIDFDFLNTDNLGTPHYAAPELILGTLFKEDSVSEKTSPDLWSMGRSFLKLLDTLLFEKGMMLPGKESENILMNNLINALWIYSSNKKHNPPSISVINDYLSRAGYSHLVDLSGENRQQARVNACNDLFHIWMNGLVKKALSLRSDSEVMDCLDMLDIVKQLISFRPEERGQAIDHLHILDKIINT